MDLVGWCAGRGRCGGYGDPAEAFVSLAVRLTAVSSPAPTGSRGMLYRSLVAVAGRPPRWRQRRRSQVRGCFGAGVEVDGLQLRPSPSSLLNGAGGSAIRRAWGWSRPTRHSDFATVILAPPFAVGRLLGSESRSCNGASPDQGATGARLHLPRRCFGGGDG